MAPPSPALTALLRADGPPPREPLVRMAAGSIAITLGALSQEEAMTQEEMARGLLLGLMGVLHFCIQGQERAVLEAMLTDFDALYPSFLETQAKRRAAVAEGPPPYNRPPASKRRRFGAPRGRRGHG